MFPGQSSVSSEAVTRARRTHPEAEALAGRARAVLGEARADRYLDPRGAVLENNRDVQIVVFLATQMYLAALHAEEVDAAASLGLSLGEYSHAVDIGALEFADALRLVDERGRCYDESPPGIMATVLAVDRETVEAVVADAQAHGQVVISNVNTPTQHVLAGVDDAVMAATQILEDDHAAHIAIIERRVPMHSPLMAPVAGEFAPALARAPWKTTTKHYLPNVTASPIAQATPAAFSSHLTRHVSEPVLWQQSVDHVVGAHPDACFLEVGPGGVLHNMMGRAWRRARSRRIDAADGDPREHFAATVEALRA